MSTNFAQVTATLGLPEWNAHGPKRLDPSLPGPHDPWCAKVMVVAGWAEGIPWLFLACRDCGWWLGYHAQYDPAELANTAADHAKACEMPPAELVQAAKDLADQIPQARQLEYEADLAAADLAESGADERGDPVGADWHGAGCGCPYCPDESEVTS